jgi:plasmid replication initiation protein
MIARIQPEDEDFKEYRVSIRELSEFIGIDKNSAYRGCKKTTENLLKRVLKIEEPGRLLQTHWVSSADYIDGEGCVILCFDPKLKPYLLQLKGNFTSCKLEMLLSFKSQYTIRFYNLLKQYQSLKTREIGLELLRDMLGIGKDQHIEYSNFKNNILKPIQKEMVEKADVTFEFDEIKYGRRVGAIRFHIFAKKLPKVSSFEQASLFNEASNTSLSTVNTQNSLLSDELLLLVPEPHRVKKTVQSAIIEFAKKQGVDYVKRNILYSNAKADKSYAGFLNSALKADWGHDWDIERKKDIEEKKQIIESEKSKKDDDARKRKESKEKHEKAVSRFYDLSQDAQDGIKNDFLESIKGNTFVMNEWSKTERANEKPIERPMIKAIFAQFLINQKFFL